MAKAVVPIAQALAAIAVRRETAQEIPGNIIQQGERENQSLITDEEAGEKLRPISSSLPSTPNDEISEDNCKRYMEVFFWMDWEPVYLSRDCVPFYLFHFGCDICVVNQFSCQNNR